MKDLLIIKKEIREHEDTFQKIFCHSFDFSNVFIKNEDNDIPLMYDHHQFITKCNNIQINDIKKAIEYQKQHNCSFIKIDSRFPLNDDLVTTFNLEKSTTLTMVNFSNNNHFKTNPNVIIKDIQFDSIEDDILNIYLKNYQEDYGETFIKQFVSTFCKKAKNDHRLHYLGAYLNNEICGYCYYFDDGNYKVIDGLTVNQEVRHQYIASSLISYIIKTSNSIIYLHADDDDTPKIMYEKMGFKPIDVLYEYSCTKI